ncbi:MAG: TIGR04283 family arsenosugar biosynthesis glycosyltransferase [Caldimicrobium sp.]|nr:TIGR04283 family arsenosugar biosynthesis glycosyltransferase [Caldimicrobium sp.]MDW8094539.1 TIGR04283 family arsenosugar biosynthesis glycosyltransferase [Caldimicrobium sp.]
MRIMIPLSVIIPSYNEEKNLKRLLRSLSFIEPDEVIVVDGGSQDRTTSIALREGAKVILSEKGRGYQLRKGAEASRGELLLFLHGDTFFEERIDLRRYYFKGFKAGFFELCFDYKPGFSLVILERLINLRASLFSLPYGDQGLFIEREIYFQLGGFKEMPLLEDLDFVLRLRKLYPPKALPHKIIVSSRKLISRFPLYPFFVR